MVRSRGNRRRNDDGDSDDDRDDIDDRPVRKKGNTALVLLAVGGVGGLLLVCLLACGIGAIVALLGDSTADKLAGSWKGRFIIGPAVLDVVYVFHKDGSFRQESFDRFGRLMFSDGRWRFRDGKIEIDWNNGSFERATVTWIDDNTMTYRIVDHTQGIQVGLTTTFRRQ